MDDNGERMRILELIDSGQISAEEGVRLLAALPGVEEAAETATSSPVEDFVEISAAENSETTAWKASAASGAYDNVGSTDEWAQAADAEVLPDSKPPDFERWRGYWTIPLWIGVGVTVVGGLLMGWAVQASGVGFWFVCATIPFIIGVLVMFFGWQSRNARWLHLRVQQAPGERPQRIALSFPLPVGLSAWFIRTFRNRIPGMENVPQDVDQLLYAVRDGTNPENPIYIKVDDDEDGEKVEIFIG